MITVVPCTPLVTKPVVASTDATDGVALFHVPFVDVLVNVIVDPPAHIRAFPPITAGDAFTVTVVTAVPQPLSYVITVVPCTPLVTTPVVASTDATLAVALLHVPLVDVLVSVVVAPDAHMVTLPAIDAGAAFTVTVVTAVPQPLS